MVETVPERVRSTVEPEIVRAADVAGYDPDLVRPVPLCESPTMRCALVALEPGQAIDLHAPDVDLVVAVLEGVGRGRPRQ